MRTYRSLLEKFIRRISTTADGCIEWEGPKDRQGYAVFSCPGNNTKAHRWLNEFLFGPIPKGLELDHLCMNQTCVNPAHLERVTHAENVRRWAASVQKRTHCKRGHEFDEENTYNYKGHRSCKSCSRQRAKNKYHQSRN